MEFASHGNLIIKEKCIPKHKNVKVKMNGSNNLLASELFSLFI